ncbi:MAG: response regulator [Lachnospiraceae bacterium]|nr:response regulator [Lachnospiraceae bacterium]
MYATDVRLVYPVSSIALCADELIHSGSDPEKLDENVERIRSLDICTGDEIEKLYDAIRDLAENQAEQIRSMVSQNQMLQEDEGKLKEQMEIISSIAGIYNSMYELDLDRNTFRELRAGYASVEEVAGKDQSDLQHVIDLMLEKTIHPASIDVDLIGALDLAFINETLGETGVWTKEVMNPDKKWRRGRIIASKREEDGRISRILWLTEDIDKERKEREQLISDSERAKAASEAKSLFLSNMSHEIRTPINAVLGMNEMILRECDDPDILKYSETIKTAGSTLLGLINDILDISKIEANKMEIIPVEYDLSSLLNDLVCMIRPRAEDKGLVLKLQFDPEIPRLLYGDEVRIKQVITNILTNAVKYTEEGSVTFSIGYEEEAAPYGIRLLVSIKDTGIGIKPEDMEKLFSEFERIEEERNRNVEGTGLGMNITQRLLEMMDSKLEVESVYGEGSDFHFALKQMVVKREKLGDYEAAFRASAESQRKYKEKFTAPEARILVADDTEMNLNVFKGLLKRTLVQIETAGSGEEALSLFEIGKFDVIFLDHMMPGMDGIETLHRMRGREGSDPVVPTICLTANAISGAREKYLSEGFEDYLTKPIDANKLEEMLIQYLPKEKVVLTGDGEGSDEEASLDGSLPEWLMHCEGVDAAEGVMYCGGAEEYLSVLGDFYDELKRKAEEIEKDYHSGDIRNYTIRVHALKSSARIIGAAGLSEKARLLEEAGDREDLDYIRENTEELLNDYRAFEEILAPVKEAREELPEIPEDMLKDAYAGILEFAGAEDYELVRMVMDSVKEYSLSPEDEARFAAIREKLSQMDWEGIRKEAEGQIS